MIPNLPPGAPDPGREAVERTLRAAYGLDGIEAAETMIELEGGASTRRFFRASLDDESLIAMYMPKPSAELAAAKQANQARNFLEVERLLRQVGIPVPEVRFGGPDDEVLLLEDLGDTTLARALETRPDLRVTHYPLAVGLIARAQRQLEKLPKGSCVLERSFDSALLDWEFEHFRTWALKARGFELSEADDRTFERAKAYLVGAITQLPYGFCHRDYQSKNLMLPAAGAQSLVWIDFQDAMLGPRVYDLVALLRDSYQNLDEVFVLERLREYHEHRPHPSGFAALRFEFDLVTAQRKLKDAGRFIFLDRKMGNSSFLPYVKGSLEMAHNALARLAGHSHILDDLHSLVTRVIEAEPELALA